MSMQLLNYSLHFKFQNVFLNYILINILGLKFNLKNNMFNQIEEISCRKCGKIISKELAFHLNDEICQTCFDERNPRPETYTCPHCHKKQKTIINWINASIAQLYGVKSGQFQKDINQVHGEHESYMCPTCEQELSYEFVHSEIKLMI